MKYTLRKPGQYGRIKKKEVSHEAILCDAADHGSRSGLFHALSMDPHWKADFDTQAYYDLAHGPFNDIMPYCKGRLVWRGSGYEKGYLGQEPRFWEGGDPFDLTVPRWEP